MPGPLVLRWIGDRQVEVLFERGRVAFYSRVRLGVGDRVMVWFERGARWVHARVVGVFERPSYRVVEGLLADSGFGSVDEWLEYESRRHDGSLPSRIIVLEAVGVGEGSG